MIAKRMLVLWGLIFVTLAPCVSKAVAGEAPQPPWPLTVKACQAYVQQAHAYLKAAYSGYFACSAESPSTSRLAPGKSCNALTRKVYSSLTIYPGCSNHQVRICDGWQKTDDAYQCLKEATQQEAAGNKERRKIAQENLDRLRDARTQIAKGAAVMDASMRLASDWRVHAREVIAPRLGKSAGRELIDLSFRSDIQSMKRQQTIVDVVLADGQGTVLGRGMSDPLVREIADTSLGYSRIVLNQVANAVLDLNSQVSEIGSQMLTAYKTSHGPSDFRPEPVRPMQAGPAGPGIQRRQATDECAVLQTPAATDMAIDEPGRFNALRKRCQPR